MLPAVVAAYESEGFRLRLGSPRLRTTGVYPIGARRYVPNFENLPLMDWGFTVRDFYLFMLLGRAMRPRNCLIIGNAYGVSAVSIAELLKPCAVDVIDAEVIGAESVEASDLTRRVAARLGLDLKLTAGFSPQDLGKACRSDAYDLVFVDGDHTNEQIVLDFQGVLPRLSRRCAVVFHDVGNLSMDDGWREVKRMAEGSGLIPFDLPFTDFGDTILIRGEPDLEYMFGACCHELRELPEAYRAGWCQTFEGQIPRGEVALLPHDSRIAFYGAGGDLAMYREFIERNPRHVAAIFDDDRSRWGERRFGVPVHDPATLRSLGITDVVVSTRSRELEVRSKMAQLAPEIPTWPRGRFERPVSLKIQEPVQPPRQRLRLPEGAQVAFYGAGSDLEPYADFIRAHPHVVVEDGGDVRKQGTSRFGVRVVQPSAAAMKDLFAVVVSTRSREHAVREAMKRLAPDTPLWPLGICREPVELCPASEAGAAARTVEPRTAPAGSVVR